MKNGGYMKKTKRLYLYTILCAAFVQFTSVSTAYADPDEEALRKGEALYQAYHVSKGRLEEAIAIFEKVL